MSKDLFEDVKNWHKDFGLDIPNTPVAEPDWLSRWKVTIEELREFEDSMVIKDKENCLKEIVDSVFTLIGTAVKFGWDFPTAWQRLLDSNYSKKGPDGEIYFKDGKIMKGPNFVPMKTDDLV